VPSEEEEETGEEEPKEEEWAEAGLLSKWVEPLENQADGASGTFWRCRNQEGKLKDSS